MQRIVAILDASGISKDLLFSVWVMGACLVEQELGLT